MHCIQEAKTSSQNDFDNGPRSQKSVKCNHLINHSQTLFFISYIKGNERLDSKTRYPLFFSA